MARTRRGPLPSRPGLEPSRRYTLGDIALKTAVPPRLLQFWTDSRLLQPEDAGEHPGRGIPRLFSVVELQIASLLWPLSMGGLTIGRLQGFAYIFRGALDGTAPPRQPMVGGAILDYAEIRRVLVRGGAGHRGQLFHEKYLSRRHCPCRNADR
jgi:hypothetical protein